jgi:protein phosphatase 1G
VPNRQKETETGEGNAVRYVAMGMQGWRRTQEDAHIAHINLEPQGNNLFGVFDGHGG